MWPFTRKPKPPEKRKFTVRVPREKIITLLTMQDSRTPSSKRSEYEFWLYVNSIVQEDERSRDFDSGWTMQLNYNVLFPEIIVTEK